MAATARLIFVQFIFIICQETSNASDPCNEKLDFLPHLNERRVGHIPKANDTLICDYYLTEEKWYSLTEMYVLANSTKRCGTTFNWYQKDPLPKSGTKNVTVCRNAGSSHSCSGTKLIQVRKCEKGYVFRLPPLDGCAEAYCIQNKDDGITAAIEAPDISSITPTINVEVVNIGGIKSTLEFYCDIIPPTGTKYYYVVEWSLHSGESYATSLYTTRPTQHLDVKDFHKSTSLKERHLKFHGIKTVGFTLGCSVKAQKDLVGDFSTTRASPPKFFGIEVHNMNKLTLKNDENRTVYLKLTVPFGCGLSKSCSLNIHTFIPKIRDTCFISHPSHMARKSIFCGVIFYNTDFQNAVLRPFTIVTKFGNSQLQATTSAHDVELTTPSQFSAHPFFANYHVASIRVELEVDQTILQNRRCYSHSDPHMKTFDGATYDNQRNGTFIMYRHTELEIEVQTKTSKCSKWDGANWHPWCNCAVAVRAGRDLFIIDHCDKNEVRPHRLVLCDDGVLKRNIKRKANTYKIFLPSGGTVELDDDTEFINVDILPSLTDFKKTEGLCGLFDKTNTSSRDPRPGTKGIDNSVSWMVDEAAGENLFDSRNYGKLKHWKEDIYLCDCNVDLKSISGTVQDFINQAECDTKTKLLCHDDKNMKPVSHPTCEYDLSSRKKRDLQSGIEVQEFDYYTDAATAYFATRDFYQAEVIQLEQHSKERRSAYDNSTARQDCLKLMNTSAFRMCNNIPNLNFGSLIENCVSDAVATNSMEWTQMHLEKIKSHCIHHVDVLQPLPPEILAELVLPESNITNSTNTTEDANNTLAFQSLSTPTQAISPELLNEIKFVSCPNECNGNGRCINGECNCVPPFTSFDCSINSTKPPVIAGIPDKGKCDLRARKCAETSILGRNFAETSSLRCRLVPFIMDKNNNVTHSTVIETSGRFESLLEVYCPLQTIRSKRSTHEGLRGDFISRGYRVSVSNNGVDFSDEDAIVIFDSHCVSCSKAPGQIICTTKTGYCMEDGRCYRPGDMSRCYVCREKSPGHLTWEAGPDCPKPIVSEENGKLWIIGAVLGPVAALILVATAAVCYIGKRAKASKGKIGSMVEVK